MGLSVESRWVVGGVVDCRKSSVKVMCPRCRDVYVGYNDGMELEMNEE